VHKERNERLLCDIEVKLEEEQKLTKKSNKLSKLANDLQGGKLASTDTAIVSLTMMKKWSLKTMMVIMRKKLRYSTTKRKRKAMGMIWTSIVVYFYCHI
jgi:hypothetical protein